MLRYHALTDDDQLAFRARQIPKDDLDAIEKALDELKDPLSVVVPLTPTHVATNANAVERIAAAMKEAFPLRPPMPIASELDEGGVRPRADYEPLQGRLRALEQAAGSWVKNLIEESRGASVPIAPWPKKDGTRRGYHLLDGVITLAEGGFDKDDTVRELAATAADSDAPYFAKTAGQAVGILNVNEALTFASLCAALVHDGYLTLEVRRKPEGTAA
jgi:hypothetical protein